MDEYNSGMDPEVKRYFKKIINSFSWGLLWLMVMATAGIFFKLGYINSSIQWYNFLFYAIGLVSFFYLLKYYKKVWNS